MAFASATPVGMDYLVTFMFAKRNATMVDIVLRTIIASVQVNGQVLSAYILPFPRLMQPAIIILWIYRT